MNEYLSVTRALDSLSRLRRPIAKRLLLIIKELACLANLILSAAARLIQQNAVWFYITLFRGDFVPKPTSGQGVGLN
jgi:hypothetical protein